MASGRIESETAVVVRASRLAAPSSRQPIASALARPIGGGPGRSWTSDLCRPSIIVTLRFTDSLDSAQQ